MKILIFSLSLFMFNNAYSQHFVDLNSEDEIKELEFIWHELYRFYENDLPEQIKVKYHEGRFSGFEPPNILWISYKHKNDHARYLEVVKHELSHLGIYKATEGASYTNRFRFLDEGLADVLSFENKEDEHRKNCLKISKDYLKKERISLSLVMDWKVYFGNPYGTGEVDFNAYRVSSNFIYFIIDTFGKEKLKSFLWKLSKKANLNRIFCDEFQMNKSEIENLWIEYIRVSY